MSLSLAALLAGLFIVPLVLLWLGQRLRRRSDVRRGVFWGAVVGYVTGMLVTVTAMHYPPVPWSGGWRTVLVHWGMLAGAALGAAPGWMMGRTRTKDSSRRPMDSTSPPMDSTSPPMDPSPRSMDSSP